jgi:hypothetical protein
MTCSWLIEYAKSERAYRYSHTMVFFLLNQSMGDLSTVPYLFKCFAEAVLKCFILLYLKLHFVSEIQWGNGAYTQRKCTQYVHL